MQKSSSLNPNCLAFPEPLALQQHLSLAKLIFHSDREAKNTVYIGDLLSRDRSLSRANWYQPDSKNAWYYYRQILKSSPNNLEAKEGLESVKQKVAEQASIEISKNNLALGKQHLNFLKGVDSTYPKIPYLEAELDHAVNPRSNKNREISRLYRQVGKELRATRISIAAKNYKQIKHISPYPALLSDLGERIANYYSEQAVKRMQIKGWQEAGNLVRSGLQYVPQHQKLLQLQQQLKKKNN